MVGDRWLGWLMRCLILSAMGSAGGCASVEYRVPTWEVERLTQLPPTMRGGEVRVVPSNAVVPPPPPLVADAPPPPEVGIDVEIPVVVAPRPLVVAPRPVVFPRQVGSTVAAGPGAAPPAGSGWKAGPAGKAGGWRPASAPSRATPTSFGRSGGGRHGGGGGAGAAAGAVAAVALVAILADAAITAAEADAARRYDGWVAVDANHPLRLFYGRGLGRVVPLVQLGPADLIGLQNAVLVEGDGHVEPLRSPPLLVAGLPPPPVAPPSPAPTAPQGPGATPTPSVAAPAAPPALATPPPAPAAPPAPVPQAFDPETP
jgi:hypothetical protein